MAVHVPMYTSIYIYLLPYTPRQTFLETSSLKKDHDVSMNIIDCKKIVYYSSFEIALLIGCWIHDDR